MLASGSYSKPSSSQDFAEVGGWILTRVLPDRMRLLRMLIAAALLATLSGCGTTYVLQAATGQWHVMRERKPIDSVLADPHTSDSVKQRLTDVRAAREFASRELKLPNNKSYRSYADVHRPYVVWNVVATPEFSVIPKRWCFPIVGCVAYRGYFSEKRARAFAADLAKRGFDVTLDGVPAYSTLGKFADPVLSTMFRYGDDDLAAIIFHELSHQLLYIPNDTEFNEAFATTVEDAGLQRWLKYTGQAGRFERYREDREREREFVDLFARTRTELVGLYASALPPREMREKKADVFARLGTEIRELEERLGVHSSLYDQWITEGLNNARLASLANYYDCVPGFERLLAEQGDDLERFYAAARQMAKLPRAQRHETLCRTPATLPTSTPAGTAPTPGAAQPASVVLPPSAAPPANAAPQAPASATPAANAAPQAPASAAPPANAAPPADAASPPSAGPQAPANAASPGDPDQHAP